MVFFIFVSAINCFFCKIMVPSVDKDILLITLLYRKGFDIMEQNDTLLLKLMDGFPDSIIVTDSASGSIVYKNHKAESFFPNEVQKKDDCSCPCPLLAQVSDVSAISLSEPMELSCCNNQRILRIHSYLLDWNGLPAYAHIFTEAGNTDAEEIAPLTDCLDKLTQTFDRRFCYLTLEDWIFSFCTFTVGFLDIDNLNKVNTDFGFESGDEYLCTVTELVRQQLSAQECLCRLGGDEFVLLSPTPCEQEMIQMLENIRAELSCLSTDYSMSFSYGIMEAGPDADMTPDAILECVSSMMYKYKQSH